MARCRRPCDRERRRDRAARTLAPRRRRPIADAARVLRAPLPDRGRGRIRLARRGRGARSASSAGSRCCATAAGTPAGFVPPAWQISDAARSVLADFGFRYTTTLRTITALPTGARFAVPCLGFSSRSALRRTLSLRWNGWQLAATPRRSGAADRAASDRRALRGDARRLAPVPRGRAARSARGHEERALRGARAVDAAAANPIAPRSATPSCSTLTGLTRCASKPAAREAARSSSRP